MGGKHKQAQRIKNNARPSSSGRSAELLANSSQIPQFSTVKEIRFVPPTLSLMKTEEFDTSVSPAFQIVFKKMNKKDCTTKIKALQEFSDLIASSEAEAVKAILGFWATLYSIMATDADHRVREAVHNAHYQIVSKDKKMIAPFLKQLIGPWFTSQYDNYPPAASAAQKAFTAAFPPNKVQDCVVFCQKEVLTYIGDNLTSKLEANPKSAASNDESEAKFERVIISTLQGYCLYLETLTAEQIEKSLELNKHIISNSRFVKLAGNKSALVRAAWFKLLATLYHKAPFLLEEDHGRIIPVIFNNLDENEPAVVGFVWEAALLIMEMGEEWLKFINVEKMYVPKLKKVLREGGQGHASVIYPNLLSILNKLPPALKVNQFYDNFFENLRFGLKKRSVLNSKSESAAVATALVECLQYVILINQKNTDLCEKLIKSHLVPLLEWSLKAENACYRTVFHQIALLVQYWNRNKNIENYSKYLTLFWTQLIHLFESNFEENPELRERQVTLMQHLKNLAKPKEIMKVKFSESHADHDSHVTHQLDQSYNENLTQVSYAMIGGYVRQMQENKSKVLLPNLFALIRLFESREFLIGLSEKLEEGGDLNGTLVKTLLIWLKSEDFCSEIIVELIFLLLKHLKDVEKEEVLSSLLEFSNDTFAWCIKNAFSHLYNTDLAVQKWIRNKQVSDFLISNTDANLTDECPPNLKNLFKLALTEIEGRLLVEQETITQIIGKIKSPLLQPDNYSLSIDTCVRLASYVADMIYNDFSWLKFDDDLLLALFQFSCSDHSDLEFLTEDTQWEIDTSWQDVVTTLSKNLSKDDLLKLISKLALLVETTFMGNHPSDSATNKLVDVIVNVIKAVYNGQPMIITDIYKLFFDRDFLPKWRSKIDELCITAEYLVGRFANNVGSKKSSATEMSQDQILKYFVWNLMKISVLSAPLENEDDWEDDDEEKELVLNEIIYVMDDNKILLSDLVQVLSATQIFLRQYKCKYFTKIGQVFEVIKTKLSHLIKKLQIRGDITQVLVSNLSSSFWHTSIFLLYHEISSESHKEVFLLCKNLVKNDLGELHLTQTYGSYLNFDQVELTPSVFDSVVKLRHLTHCDEIDVQIAEVFEKVKKLRSQDVPRFLLDNKDLSWQEMETIIEVVRLFSRLMDDKFESLSRNYWDFGVICLSSWASNCYKMRASYDNEQTQSFMLAVCELYITLYQKIRELKSNNVKNSFVEEWEELFLPNVHTELLQLWLYLADQFASKPNLPLDYHPFIQQFGRITDHFTYELLFSKDGNLPSWSKLLKRCCSLLMNSNTMLQLWGYKMLLRMVPGLIDIDLQSDRSSTPNAKGFSVEQFKDVLEQTHVVVNAFLARFKLGEDSCQVTPFSDSYTYIFAYLLLWSVFLTMCENSPPELRYQYADWLRSDNYFKSLLNNLFKLIPTEILHYSEGKAKALSKLFMKEPTLDLKEACTSEILENVSCWIYAFSLSQLPALVRQWWSETETKVSQIVEKITSFYVSPQLCNQELHDVGHRENNFKNMTIKIIPSVREVIAIYTVDEAQMELVISLPQNYPLGGPTVRCNKQIGGPLHKQWLMQLKKYLLHQNGRIWDGLALWNGSLDKKFDGVEECYICFAVLHPGTYQLPRLSCQTCKKKFHSACLYKWFSTSNKSSCPICRNLF